VGRYAVVAKSTPTRLDLVSTVGQQGASVRAWSDATPPPPGDPATLEELRRAAAADAAAAGGMTPPAADPGSPNAVDLLSPNAADPTLPAGAHRHGDVVHPEAHAHPHVSPPSDGRPVIGIVGGGPVGLTLGAALAAAGWQVGAIASRDPGRRERFRLLVPGARFFAEPAAVLDECHLAILAVPDDAIASVAAGMHLYSGQALVHTSGLHGTEVLASARAAGTSCGSFHPLVAFADVDRALAALRGATVAIEGDDDILDILAEMAESIGALPVRLVPGSKPAYHAAAVLAAGGLVALLDVVAQVAALAGLDEGGALAVYGPLAAQALGNARALGTASALTGPAVRGDAGTIDVHLAALTEGAPGALETYRALLRRQVDIAEARRGLAPETATRLRADLAERR
jgi:predicted short-subunit dehydrogenase-like oxidoreductase (DUF2520 family)